MDPMENPYSSVTLNLPVGYYVANLSKMALLIAKFRGIKVVQGSFDKVSVSGDENSSEWQAVSEWAAQNLPRT